MGVTYFRFPCFGAILLKNVESATCRPFLDGEVAAFRRFGGGQSRARAGKPFVRERPGDMRPGVEAGRESRKTPKNRPESRPESSLRLNSRSRLHVKGHFQWLPLA